MQGLRNGNGRSSRMSCSSRFCYAGVSPNSKLYQCSANNIQYNANNMTNGQSFRKSKTSTQTTDRPPSR
eukprot:4530848-Amphidinium_carterae.1